MLNSPRQESNDSYMMTPKEAAVLLCVSINTLRRWNDRGILKAYRIGSRGDRRFLRKDIELLLYQLHENGGDERRTSTVATLLQDLAETESMSE